MKTPIQILEEHNFFSSEEEMEAIISYMEIYAEQFKPQPKLSIEERKRNFADLLKPFTDSYNREMLLDFYYYWIEHSPNGKKLRFEREKVFDVKLRLIRWSKNQKNGVSKHKPNIENVTATAEAILRQHSNNKYGTGNQE